eukprot:jgi/Botrbrau1/3958/Bobra.0365s0031.1
MLQTLFRRNFHTISATFADAGGILVKLQSFASSSGLVNFMTRMLATAPAPCTSLEPFSRSDGRNSLCRFHQAHATRRVALEDTHIAASLLQVLQKEEIIAALSSLELLQRLPFGNNLELTVAGLYALSERAQLSCLQLSTAMALALLYCLDSFEHCVGGEGALLYTLQHTYLSAWGNMSQERIDRWCSQVAAHQSEILRMCGYNVWIREELHLGPAFTTLTSQPFLESQLQQVCENVHQHTSVRLAVKPAGSGPLAPVTPPQCTVRTHTDMMKVAYKYILDAQHNHETRMAEMAKLAIVSDVKLLKRLYISPEDAQHQSGSLASDASACNEETPMRFRPAEPIAFRGGPGPTLQHACIIHNCCSCGVLQPEAKQSASTSGNGFLYEDSKRGKRSSFAPGKENKDPDRVSFHSKLRPSQGRMCKARKAFGKVKSKGGHADGCARRQPSSRIVRLRTMRTIR